MRQISSDFKRRSGIKACHGMLNYFGMYTQKFLEQKQVNQKLLLALVPLDLEECNLPATWEESLLQGTSKPDLFVPTKVKEFNHRKLTIVHKQANEDLLARNEAETCLEPHLQRGEKKIKERKMFH